MDGGALVRSFFSLFLCFSVDLFLSFLSFLFFGEIWGDKNGVEDGGRGIGGGGLGAPVQVACGTRIEFVSAANIVTHSICKLFFIVLIREW